MDPGLDVVPLEPDWDWESRSVLIQWRLPMELLSEAPILAVHFTEQEGFQYQVYSTAAVQNAADIRDRARGKAHDSHNAPVPVDSPSNSSSRRSSSPGA